MTQQPTPLYIEPPQRQPPRLRTQGLTVGYEQRIISENLNVAIPDRSFTVIVGPNGCGKSTLLRSLCRLLKPVSGEVLLNGQDIHRYPAKLVARQLGLLPQSANTPEGIRVRDLVARGRYPHQSAFRRWSREDESAVNAAMISTSVEGLADRMVDELSGGQRQRVWVAMALAQQTSLLLLDEPTTYLDITHQIELLELFRTLNRRDNRTLIAVLHDLNHACRYATHLIAMRDGAIIAEGPPASIISEALVEEVFGLSSLIIEDPVSHTPLVIPRGKGPAQTLSITDN